MLFLLNSCIGIFLTYGLFFNSVSGEFHAAATSTSLVFGAYAVLYAISSLLLGLVTQTYGAGKTILIGGVLMSVGLLASAFATSIEMLLVTYAIGGLGIGGSWLPSTYVVLERFNEKKVNATMGMVSAGTAFGTLIFSPIESYFILSFGWRSAFLVVGLITLVITYLAYLASRGGQAGRRFDLRGAISKLRSKRFASLYLYYMIGNAFARTMVVIFVVPLIEANGLGLYVGSLALSLIGVGSLVGRVVITRVQRVSEEIMTAWSFILQGICTVGFLYSFNPFSVALLSLLFGIGYGAYIPEFPLLTKKYYGTENYGAIFGVLLTSFGFGALVGPFFQGYEISGGGGGFLLGFSVSAAASIGVGLHFLSTAIRRRQSIKSSAPEVEGRLESNPQV